MAAFAVAQRGFGSHALSDVAPDRGDENAVVRFPAAQRHVERNQHALFTAAGDLKRARGATGVDEGRASFTAIFLQQDVDLLVKQLRGGIAEYLFGSAIDPLDRAVKPDGDDGVVRGIDDRVIACVLALAQHALARDRHRDVVDLKQTMLNAMGSTPAAPRHCAGAADRPHRATAATN